MLNVSVSNVIWTSGEQVCKTTNNVIFSLERLSPNSVLKNVVVASHIMLNFASLNVEIG